MSDKKNGEKNKTCKRLVDFYFQECLKQHKFKPETGGKAMKIFSSLLEVNTEVELIQIILLFLKDDSHFVSEQGWAIHLLPSQMNKYKAVIAKPKQANKNLLKLRV